MTVNVNAAAALTGKGAGLDYTGVAAYALNTPATNAEPVGVAREANAVGAAGATTMQVELLPEGA